MKLRLADGFRANKVPVMRSDYNMTLRQDSGGASALDWIAALTNTIGTVGGVLNPDTITTSGGATTQMQIIQLQQENVRLRQEVEKQGGRIFMAGGIALILGVGVGYLVGKPKRKR